MRANLQLRGGEFRLVSFGVERRSANHRGAIFEVDLTGRRSIERSSNRGGEGNRLALVRGVLGRGEFRGGFRFYHEGRLLRGFHIARSVFAIEAYGVAARGRNRKRCGVVI